MLERRVAEFMSTPAETLSPEMTLKELALRYALSGTGAHVALVGLATPGEVDDAATLAGRGLLSAAWLDQVVSSR